ncbi:MAG: ATP-binding protein, partial [Methylocystaceae bacterium]
GSGPAALYPVLRWNHPGGIVGVIHPDQVTLDTLIGYQRQKDSLLNNTQRLISGLPSSHALLYGPRGSGKSSLIKAVAQHFYTDGLRLIEVASEDLETLPAIVDYVRGRCQYFVIYIDDLSFEAYETGYKSLKNLLEGGVENRPANLVVYATSNRRHIVQEYYSDRLGGDDLHPGETRQEKLALADRFGLSIFFPNADQQLYLEMVMIMADRRGINLPESELTSRALTWEKEKSGPSGRAARQFVDSL